jgi:hydrogenase maturation protein HypF
VADLRRGQAQSTIAARFHRGLAAAVVEVCRRIRNQRGIDRVVLSGGVWQNMFLLRLAVQDLEQAGFEALWHRRVPANDGGLALGQVAVAAARLRSP